jgi:hypothetical protein
MAPPLAAVFFDRTLIMILVVAGAVFLFVASLLIRLVRGSDEESKQV